MTINLAPEKSFSPKVTCINNSQVAVKFGENYIKQDKVSSGHKNVVNFFIAYEVNKKLHDLKTNFTLSHRYRRKILTI